MEKTKQSSKELYQNLQRPINTHIFTHINNIEVMILYIPGKSEKIKRIGNKYNVKIILNAKAISHSFLIETKTYSAQQS